MHVLVRGTIGVALSALLLSVAAAPTEAGSSVTVGNIWATPATQNTSSAYAYIRNGGSSGDTLLGAAAPYVRSIQLAHTVQHAMPTPSGKPITTGSAADGQSLPLIAAIQVVASAPVPAGGALILKPGGYHLILQGITRHWNLGDSFEIELHFKQAGWIRTTGFVDER